MIESGMSIEALFEQLNDSKALIEKDLAEFGVKASGQVIVTYALNRSTALEVRQEVIEQGLELVRIKKAKSRILCEVHSGGSFSGRYVIMSNTHYKRTRKSIDAIRVNQANRMFDQVKNGVFHGFGSNKRKSA